MHAVCRHELASSQGMIVLEFAARVTRQIAHIAHIFWCGTRIEFRFGAYLNLARLPFVQRHSCDVKLAAGMFTR